MTVKKPLVVLLMIAIVLMTVFIAGCTGNVTNTTSLSPATSTAKTTSKASTTPKATAIPAATSTPTASEFTATWERNNPDDILVTPFTMSVNERGHVTYTGLTKGLYSHGDETNIFELCKDEADAQQTYQKLVQQASLSGYHFGFKELNTIQDRTTVMGFIPAPSSQELVNSIIIAWAPPNDYGIGYYVQTTKRLAPNTSTNNML